MSIIDHDLDRSWSLIIVRMWVNNNDQRTMMYASHRNCGWVPPIQRDSLGERTAQCSGCGVKLSEKMDHTVRVHNFVMKIGD